jgi:hypothetical protein
MLLAPVLGFLLLHGRVDAGVRLLYFVAGISAGAGALMFIMLVKPLTYGVRPIGLKIAGKTRGLKKWWYVTPAVQIGLMANLVAAGLAYFLAR